MHKIEINGEQVITVTVITGILIALSIIGSFMVQSYADADHQRTLRYEQCIQFNSEDVRDCDRVLGAYP